MAYSKSAFAQSMGWSNKELEDKAKAAGFSTTEEFYNATGGTGRTYEDIMRGQQEQETNFLNRYRADIPTIYNRLSQEYGLPGLQQSATQAMQTYEDIPGQEKTAGKQFGISSSRLQRRIAGRQAEYAPIAQRFVGAAQQAGELVSQGFQREIQPYVVEAEMISDRLAREFTGYTNAMQRSLDVLLQKLTNEGNLDTTEMEQLGELAKQENQYDLMLRNYEEQKKIDQQYKTPAQGDWYSTLDSTWNTPANNQSMGQIYGQSVPGAPNNTVWRYSPY